MPRLDGLAFNTETIRTYNTFYVSKFEAATSLNIGSIIKRLMDKCVANICYDCTLKGYYIVGLERGVMNKGVTPGLEDKSLTMDVIPYSMTLGLYVRRFMSLLTVEEIYYWSAQATERILYELNQPKYTIGIDLAADNIKEGTITNLGATTVPASAVIDFTSLQGLLDFKSEAIVAKIAAQKALEDTKVKPKKYKIIKRPKLCYSNTTG